ncbi:MAG: FIST C-terminal domain-containing protein [Magnetococcales bacterium]|nr:FIST C-terminal domain-containing protein [Magnetococcales bacterium]
MKIAQKVFLDGRMRAEGLRELAAIDPHLILVFGSRESFADAGMFAMLRRHFPAAGLAGCTTAGEIAGSRVHDGACVVTAMHLERSSVRVRSGRIGAMEESRAVGERLGRELAGEDLQGVLLFCKGVAVNGSAVIEGVMAGLGRPVPVTGGLAGDGSAFARTLVLDNDEVSETGVVGIGLHGDAVRVGHGSQGGWEPFGPARRITRSSGNILYELDGKPALDLYKSYLGEYARNLPASGLLFPFEMLGMDHARVGLIRTILGIDETSGSLILAGDIMPDGFLRLMHASTDALVSGAESAARKTREMVRESGAGLALLVSCVGRKLVMGDQVDEEVEVVLDALAEGSVATGFYSYGEISPFSSVTDCRLHNQTMTVTYLTEAC